MQRLAMLQCKVLVGLGHQNSISLSQTAAGITSTWNTAWSCRSCSTTSSTSLVGLRKLLVANRGEIACRVIATAKQLGLPTVAVYSEADRASPHVGMADESVCIGPAAAKESYLVGDKILAAALHLGADAIHPGYGFLSENAQFAALCEKNGIQFVGPPAQAIQAMGDKSRAKELMSAADVPVVPGYHGPDQSISRLMEEAGRVGFPLLIKAVAGGGGKGMRLAHSAAEFPDSLASAKREAAAAFGNERVLLERWVQQPRHVEVQVFADKHGEAVYLFDRDCSVQRRHQKVIEEAPAPGLHPDLHQQLGEAAVRAAKAVGYVGAGTVEFLLDTTSQDFFFMEMNTRLQVEHPVTEAVTGLDLVEWQLRVAAGEKLPLQQSQLVSSGHAVEVRLYAENPLNNFLPGAGRVRRWRPPPAAASFQLPGSANGWVRVDSGVREGDTVGTFYDPMIAKIIVWGEDRNSALGRLRGALASTQISGLPTNLTFLQRLASHPAFVSADLTTAFIPQHHHSLLHVEPLPSYVAVLAAVARVSLRVLAVSRANSRTPGGNLGPWGVPDAKRLWHHATRTYTMEYPAADQQLQAEVTFLSDSNYAVRVGGPEGEQLDVKSVRLVEGERLEAEVDGRMYQASVLQYQHAGHEVLVLWVDGSSYEFRWEVPRWSKDAKAQVTGGGVVAPMPGRIVKVMVSEGQEVTAGVALLVVEAMKMEHTLTAHKAGKVAGLGVSAGTQVEDGQVLLRIEDGSE